MSAGELAVWCLVVAVASWCVAIGLATRAESDPPHLSPTELYTVTQP